MNLQKNSLIAGIFLLAGLTLYLAGSSLSDRELAGRLGNQVLRLHIVADSNQKFDQELKLSVRSFLLEQISQAAGEKASKEEILSFLEDKGEALMEETGRFIQEKGGNYGARLEIGKSYFPTRVYGDMVFPAGNYDAVKVVLGHGKGRNWWCVLYPSLCFVSDTQAVLPDSSRRQLNAIVSEEDYASLLSPHPKIRLSLRICQWWDSL